MPTSPRTKPAAQRRDDLLDAAAALFARQGIGDTTVEQITAAAGMAKGSFYLHFNAKEQVIVGLRERFVATVLLAVRDAVAVVAPDDQGERLAAWARACIGAYAAAAELHEIVFAQAPPPAGRAGLTDNPLIDDLAALLAAGQAAAGWPIAEPDVAALFLFNAIHGVALAAPDAAAQARLERQAIGLCLRVVGAAPPG